MKRLSLSREETLVYSKKSGATLRFRLDKRGDLWVSHHDLEVKIDGRSNGDYEIHTEADVA